MATEEPRPPEVDFPLVAVGASAGGVEAMLDLVSALPRDTGMAFVLLPHLAPKEDSHLVEILARAAPMPVQVVHHGETVAPDRIYVVPPNKAMALRNGALMLSAKAQSRGDPRSIDYFMRSVAETCGHRGIGIVLSGTGHDGTLGVVDIKGAGGITFAQDDSAQHTGMPRSAVASGAVDFVMPAHDMARELGRISRHPYLASGGHDAFGPAVLDVVHHLRDFTGVDFVHYKRNTLHRRITRRMVLHKLPDVGAYFDYLKAHAGEAEALYADVLIGLTSFFRNPESYEALKSHVFPKIAQNRGPQDTIRVWSLGCSTGEEAYSLAMAFQEYAEAAGCRTPMQVFATDLSEKSVEKARAGLYAKGIVQDVSPDRLSRFFLEVDGSYRIARQVRDMCIFARQNAVTDPPFSNIDLVACRNLLIYLDPLLQQRVIPTIHYALRDPGWLWLGASETIGAYRDLFDVADLKHKIYEKKHGSRRPIAFAVSSSSWTPMPKNAAPREPLPSNDPQREADRLIMSRYAPPGVVIDHEFEILQFRGDTGTFLAPPPGRPSLSLFKMLREALLVPVRAAVHRAKREDIPIREEGLKLKSAGSLREVDVVVLPLKGGASAGSLLVLFEETSRSLNERVRHLEAEANAAQATNPLQEGASADREVARLNHELKATREYLQSVIEQQEAANEELQSANEEVYSANEELQSINEELETSKEEIQSANEELGTVNQELQDRNAELLRSNDDFVNLLASVQMALMMLGSDLRIRRFTPAAEKLLGLRASDVGRRIGDVSLAMGLDNLEALSLEVIDSMNTREREIRDAAGRWHLLRVRPYRTQNNRIEGVVVMLLDIDAIKGAEEALRHGDRAKNEFLATLAHELRNPLAGISNAVSLLATADAAASSQARGVIERQAAHMARMVEELFDVSRITHNKIELRNEAIDLCEVLRRSISATSHERHMKEQALDFVTPEQAITVHGDPMRLDQVFSNLLNNASKFTPSGGRLRVSLEVVREGDALRAVVRVSDNGIGIDPAVLPRIFDPFVQAERHAGTASSGIGLGLTLARRLVELHGGSIEARSAGHLRGTEMTVRLPLRTGERAE